MDNTIMRTKINVYKDMVDNLNTKKIKKFASIEKWIITILVILFAIVCIIFGVMPDTLNKGATPYIVALFTLSLSSISILVSKGAFEVQKLHYSTLEKILFDLIKLEEESKSCSDTFIINNLISEVLEKMFK